MMRMISFLYVYDFILFLDAYDSILFHACDSTNNRLMFDKIIPHICKFLEILFKKQGVKRATENI